MKQNDSDTKNFHLGDILTVTTGRLLSPTLMHGVYAILDWMTGDSLFTHQLPRASRECGPLLLEQHPQLKDIEVPDFDSKEQAESWRAEQVAKYGEFLPVRKCVEKHTHIDPIAEAAEMFGSERVIVVEAGGAER